MFFSEGLKPYIVTVVATNGASEDGIPAKLIFFTKESSKYIIKIPLIHCVSHLAPPAPNNVSATRLNGTHINVTWEPIPLSQAQGIIQSYNIILQVTNNRKKRQVIRHQIPANRSSAIIGGLNPALSYSVLVGATTKEGLGTLGHLTNNIQRKYHFMKYNLKCDRVFSERYYTKNKTYFFFSS